MDNDREPIHPLQALINEGNRRAQEDRARAQLTLGELKDQLEKIDGDVLIYGLGELMSYRGYYSDLAFVPVDNTVKARDVLIQVRNAMGEVFTGYKGGDYVMGRNTPLWLADYGDASGKRFMGLEVGSNDVLHPIWEQEEWDL